MGVIGGGQLARMMAQPAIALGLELHLLAEDAGSSAAQVIHQVVVGDYTDPQTVAGFAAGVDVVTFDHEHVPTQILDDLVFDGHAVRPGPGALVYAQDKLLMRQRLTASLAAPAPIWRQCDDPAALRAFGDEVGWPLIAKASRGGYDGHGVWKLAGPQDIGMVFAQAGTQSAGAPVAIIGEEFVDFARELSVLVVRGLDGASVAYQVSETIQTGGVCSQTITPAPSLSDAQAGELVALARAIADELGVVGVLAVELMQRRDGQVVVNELAMRPHNTGHWTIDGALTSQFENHLRAVAGLPLGDTSLREPWAVMTNILGGARRDLFGGLGGVLAADPGLRVELYGKPVSPGRKVGHVTAFGDDLDDVRARSQAGANQLIGESK